MSSTLFVANWKMEKNIAQSIEFCAHNITALKKLSAQQENEIVLCPSFPALFSLNELLADTMVHIGAQNCSPHPSGAYTGQVSAQSIAQVGCNFCIVGHSEVRMHTSITNAEVAQAAKNLCSEGVEPIICIGESKEEFQSNRSLAVIEEQLDPVIGLLKDTSSPITIAYEPVWAIGTGVVPETDYLSNILSHIAALLEKNHSGPWRILYGGSISEQTIAGLKGIPNLSGYLIGSASLDFSKFEKIVSLGQ